LGLKSAPSRRENLSRARARERLLRMTLLRARSLWIFGVFLVACGGQSVLPADGADDSSSAIANPDGGTSKWVPVPFSPEPAGPIDDDPNFQPVSIKMPASSGAKDSGAPAPLPPPPPPPPDDADVPWGPPMANDIDDPEIATICADRAAAKGSFTFTPAVDGIGENAHVSSTRDLTEHRWGDAIYRTTFTLFFRDAEIYEDPSYGATRFESVSWLDVHLNSPVSRPTAFTVGQPEAVEIGWGDGDQSFMCARDGYSSLWSDAEALPYQPAIVTLTRRDATGLAGTIDIENGKRTLTFDAPFGETYPGADGICCLK
jgi:hypothetical protein